MNFVKGKYYYKKELEEMARNKGFNVSSFSKKEIESILITGIIPEKKTTIKGSFPLELNAIISPNFKIGYKERDFFNLHIPHFKFNIRFNQWIKQNKGKATYKEAIAKYQDLKGIKNQDIAPQFEYMAYIRDFIRFSPNLSLKDAIKCWKMKKEQIGSHKFEESDLEYLLKR